MASPRIVITQTDFEKLLDLLVAPESKFWGSMLHLRDRLKIGKVVPPRRVSKDVVTLNSQVSVVDTETGEQAIYTLVHPSESDIDANKLSVLSPIGSALLGTRVGQTIKCNTPRGPRTLRVQQLLYQPEASGDFHL